MALKLIGSWSRLEVGLASEIHDCPEPERKNLGPPHALRWRRFPKRRAQLVAWEALFSTSICWSPKLRPHGPKTSKKTSNPKNLDPQDQWKEKRRRNQPFRNFSRPLWCVLTTLSTLDFNFIESLSHFGQMMCWTLAITSFLCRYGWHGWHGRHGWHGWHGHDVSPKTPPGHSAYFWAFRKPFFATLANDNAFWIHGAGLPSCLDRFANFRTGTEASEIGAGEWALGPAVTADAERIFGALGSWH